MASSAISKLPASRSLFVALVATAATVAIANSDAENGLLRGSAGVGPATDVGENVTAQAQWGIWWGSCFKYGCSKPYTIGQLCGCWPGCAMRGICCSDYYQACAAPAPAPAPTTPSPALPPAPVPPSSGPSPSPAEPPAPSPLPLGPSDAPMYTLYVYRAQSTASYPPKNVNTANLAGVMWYLQHEVVTETPPKFGISRILRYKIQTKAPATLLAAGMDFGVRYAYDNQKCTGPGDCSTMYAKYGYFVGCNNFASKYPYPNMETHYDGGVWYSMPGEGACDGPPTGADDCTYSYSWPPDEITLDELTGGDSAGFWASPEDDQTNARRVRAAADLFQFKFPESAALSEPQCNFNFEKFWQ